MFVYVCAHVYAPAHMCGLYFLSFKIISKPLY